MNTLYMAVSSLSAYHHSSEHLKELLSSQTTDMCVQGSKELGDANVWDSILSVDVKNPSKVRTSRVLVR